MLAFGETRRILEPELAALAAERGTDAELDRHRVAGHEMEHQAARGCGLLLAPTPLPSEIALAARNPVLARMMDRLCTTCFWRPAGVTGAGATA